jgi:hypothetical protein
LYTCVDWNFCTKENPVEWLTKRAGKKAEILRLARDIIKIESVNAPVCMKNMPMIHLLKIST